MMVVVDLWSSCRVDRRGRDPCASAAMGALGHDRRPPLFGAVTYQWVTVVACGSQGVDVGGTACGPIGDVVGLGV